MFPQLGYCCSGLRPLRPTRTPRRRQADVTQQPVRRERARRMTDRPSCDRAVARPGQAGAQEQRQARLLQRAPRCGRCRIEPARVEFAAQPGQLALGQLAGGEDRRVAEFAAGVACRPGAPRPGDSRPRGSPAGRAGADAPAVAAARAGARTSSRKPAASIASKRCSMRCVQHGAVARREHQLQHAARQRAASPAIRAATR